MSLRAFTPKEGIIQWYQALAALTLEPPPDTTGSNHSGRPASDFSTFPLVSDIIYIGGERS